MNTRQVKLSDSEIARVLDDSLNNYFIESVMSSYNLPRAINAILQQGLGSENEEMSEVSILKLIHLQQSGLLKGSRLSTREDLEKARLAGLDLCGNNVYCGLAFINEYVAHRIENQSSAERLALQLSKKHLMGARLIPFSCLKINEDSSSYSGLTLSLEEDIAEDSIRRLTDFEWIHINTEGIAGAYLCRDGKWSSDWEELWSSYKNCRAVVVDKSE